MEKMEFLDRLAEGTLSRRRFAQALASAGLAMVAMPVAPRLLRAEDQATFFTWSGYDDPGFFPAYVEKHGGNPNMPIFSDEEEEGFQKLRAGFTVDVAHPCSGRIERWRSAGVIQPIDTARLSNWPNVFDALKNLPGTNADGKQWFVPVDWGNTSVLYRTDMVEVTEDSWTILWDERYAGRLSIGEDITDTAVIAGLVAGAKDPHDMTDDEIARVRELLLKQKPLLRFYWSDTTALEQAVATGEVVATSSWNSSASQLREQGIPVAYMKPKEGILTWCCGLVLAHDAPQPDLAYDLIDALIDPRAGEWLVNYGYGHSNRKTFEIVSEELLARRGFPKDPAEHLKNGVFSKDNKRLDDLQRMFEEVKAS